jgi:hypothetical protein
MPEEAFVGDRLPAEFVHGFELAGIVLATAVDEPVGVGPRLSLVAGLEQHLYRKCGVAKPVVAVVPVAHAADQLRERRRWGGAHCPGLLVGQEFEHQARSNHDVSPSSVEEPTGSVRIRPNPLPPVANRLSQYSIVRDSTRGTGRSVLENQPARLVPGDRPC